MLGRLADSPIHLLILLLVILVLFGASRLPSSARQLGRSMRIFRSEMREMKAESPPSTRRDGARDDRDDLDDRDYHRDQRPGRTDESDDVRPRPVEALEGRVVDEPRTGATRAEADRER